MDPLQALLDAPCAWMRADQLGDDVPGLVAAGLLDLWERPDGVCATLSPLAAARLGVRLVATSGHEVYRWSSESASARSRKPSRRQLEQMHAHDATLRQVEERRPRPPRPAEPPKPTVILWGHGLLPWDEVRTGPRPPRRCKHCAPRLRKRRFARPVEPGKCRSCGYGVRKRPRLEHCPACHGRKLSPATYCLRCDRWGLDGWFARRGLTKHKRPKSRKAG